MSIRSLRAWAGRLSGIAGIAVLTVTLAIGAWAVADTRSSSRREMAENAIRPLEAAVTFLHADSLGALALDGAGPDDYILLNLKRQLANIRSGDPDIRFTYLCMQVEGRLVFIADSEPEGSADMSPAGQVYTEADPAFLRTFEDGQSRISPATTDRWGRWISAIVPVRSRATGEVVAVLAADYPVERWREMVDRPVKSAFAVALLTNALIAILLLLVERMRRLRSLRDELDRSRNVFETVFRQAPVGIVIVEGERNVSHINPMFESITGRPANELHRLPWQEITHPDDVDAEAGLLRRFDSGEIDRYTIQKRYVRPDGTTVWVKMLVAPLRMEGSDSHSYIRLVSDVTTEVIVQSALRESERSKSVLLSHLPGLAYRCRYDRAWTMLFVSDGCRELTGYDPDRLIHNRELSFNDIIVPKYREALWNAWAAAIESRSQFKYEYEILTSAGTRKWVMEVGQAVWNTNNSVDALEGLIIDITLQKERESRIEYLNDHDYMTGLYNRNYLETALERLDRDDCLPLTVLLADVSGIRMINDAFGHPTGDRVIVDAAEVLRRNCRENDILARTGGDEFCILMPRADERAASLFMQKVNAGLAQAASGNEIGVLSLTMAGHTRTRPEERIHDAVRIAADALHRRKMLSQKSSHSAILSSIMATMYARSQETEAHAARLASLCRGIGERMGLPSMMLDQLEIFSMLHDIGKVGIDDHILNKPGRLTGTEWEIMKKHPEIGYRIAMSSPDLEMIADDILHHHERWDGTGYPEGLSGLGIPLLARILSVADSYDAMTETRVYRSAMPREAAMEEIRRCTGSQFDPEIARVFLELEGEHGSP